MGFIHEFTFEAHTADYFAVLAMPVPLIVIIDDKGIPINSYQHWKKETKPKAGQKFKAVVLPEADDNDNWRGNHLEPFHAGGMTAVYHNPDSRKQAAKAGDLKGCTPTTCWRYMLGTNDTTVEAYSSGTPGSELKKKGYISNMWIEKKGNSYRMWYFQQP